MFGIINLNDITRFSSISKLYTFLFSAICFIAFFPGRDGLFSQNDTVTKTQMIKTIHALEKILMNGVTGDERKPKGIYFIIRSINYSFS